MVSFGQNLRQAREARNITLQEIAAATKIGTRALQALEDERFDLLPGGIFNKGFVRSYARFVGLDEEATVASYLEVARQHEPQEPDLERVASQVSAARASSQDSWILNGATIVGILAVLVAIGLGGLWYREQRKEAREQAQSRAMEASQHSAQLSAPPAVVASDPAVPPAAPDAAALAAGNAASQSTPGATTALTSPEATKPATQSEPVEISISATARSWISVRSDGENVEQITLDPTKPELAKRTYKAKTRLMLITGNPAGLDVTYNGKPTGALGPEGKRSTVTFTPEGMQKQ